MLKLVSIKFYMTKYFYIPVFTPIQKKKKNKNNSSYLNLILY